MPYFVDRLASMLCCSLPLYQLYLTANYHMQTSHHVKYAADCDNSKLDC